MLLDLKVVLVRLGAEGLANLRVNCVSSYCQQSNL
jgi:hypothetical protein